MWGQKLGDAAEDHPALTSEEDSKVLKVTFATQDNENYAAKYTNPNSTVEMPEDPPKDHYTFVKWSQSNSATSGAEFTAETRVTEDMTVYAVGQENYGGDSAAISVNAVYGQGATLDLSKYMDYENGSAEKDKFTYTIEGEESAKFEITGDTLTVPKTLAVDDYTLTIKAEEKSPAYALVSVERYGTEPVTLTVNVSITRPRPP